MLQLPNQCISQDVEESTTGQQQQLVLMLTEPTTEVTKFIACPIQTTANWYLLNL